jgi:hypothetical protein
MSDRIGIHVLGPGYGESIVCELPDGQLGVIDSYLPKIPGQGVCGFLRNRLGFGGPGRERLRFLAVTHPHADHCAGLQGLLACGADALWPYATVGSAGLAEYYKLVLDEVMRQRLEQDWIERELQLPPDTVLNSILLLREEVRRRTAARGPMTALPLNSSESVLPLCGGRVKVTFITPGNRSWRRHEFRVSDAVAVLTALALNRVGGGSIWSRFLTSVQTALGRILPRPLKARAPDVRPNLISGSMLLRYGKTRILLMADAERPLWRDWEAERQRRRRLRRVKGVHLVKVAHHASDNGYHAALYASACSGTRPVAVLTPFQRGESPLPSTAGLNNIIGHASAIACTSRHALPPDHPTFPVGVPPGWAVAMMHQPRLRLLLPPPFGKAGVPPDVALSPEMITGRVEDPNLNRWLHRDVGGTTGDILPDYDEFRVSFYFDDRGNVDDYYIGPGAILLH